MTDNIIISVRAIVEFLVILLAYREVFNANIIKKKLRIGVLAIIMGVLYFVNSYFEINMFFTVIGTLYAILIPLILLEGNKKKWISLYPTLILMIIIMSMCLSYVMASILNITVMDVIYNPVLSALVDICVLAMLCLDYLYTKTRSNRRDRDVKISFIVYFVMTAGELAFVIILATMQFYISLHHVDSNIINVIGVMITFIGVVYALALLFLSAYIQKNGEINKEKEMLNLYVSEQQKHIKLMVEKAQDMKKFRHDVRQHMWVISYHLDNGKVDLAREYIAEIYENMDSTKMDHYTGVVPIDVVLSDKKKLMDEKKIVFNWSGSVNKIPDNIKEYDICTIFIAILDRAIVACEVLPESERELKLLVEINNGKLYIMEKHKYLKKNIRYEDRHIKSIAEKYNGYVIYTMEQDEYMIEVVL